MGLAVCLAFSRLAFNRLRGEAQISAWAEINFIIRLIVLSFIALLISYTESLYREVKVLEVIFPTCSSCKRVRTENDTWVQMEAYNSERSDALFSHGSYDDCLKRLYPDWANKLASAPRNTTDHVRTEDKR